MTPKRKRSWLFWEWLGAVALGVLPDHPRVNSLYAHIAYWLFNQRRWPDLKNPVTFNERMILLKLSDEARTPIRTRITDKEFVKVHVAEIIGPGRCVPTLAILRTARDIDQFDFPLPCVVKPTHSSQEVMAFETRQPDPSERRKLKYWLQKSYFPANREPNYKGLDHKLIVEPIVGGSFGALDDIKVFCFFGEPRLIQVDRGRFLGRHSRDFYDVRGQFLPIAIKYPSAGQPFAYARELDEVLRFARALSRGFTFLRVDFYVDHGNVLVGELTSFPSNCVQSIKPAEADAIVAKALEHPGFEIGPDLFRGLPEPTIGS